MYLMVLFDLNKLFNSLTLKSLVLIASCIKNSSSDISDEEDEKRRRSRRRDRSPRSKSRSRSKDRRKRKGKDDEGVFGPVLREMVMNELKDHKDLHGLFKKIDRSIPSESAWL